MRAQLIAIFCLIFLSTQSLASETFVGKTVSQVIQVLGVDLASGTVIDEPPAVARGIEFRPQEGIEIQVFIKRGQVPLTIEGGDNMALYKDLKVIGIRKVENRNVYCEGDVLWHFQC
ncbi:hypothetical protein LQ564_05590 [Massilia sp. G4R7]|uniref:Uncharacterized protein n=1 Tax=Massilia phyllostachyos TaxID=2898585 RepID=A0ABS8Q232_9BURK|nr:hypothetical protein [Massilia phyllostachyos]MCD2515785.1 hypothetical protein [Massilia phyllostachyos]